MKTTKRALLLATAVICCLQVTATAQAKKGILSSKLKLAPTLPVEVAVEENVEAADSKKVLRQDDPEFHYYKKPFTSTIYYDYMDSFLLGLKLETFFKGSDACIDSIVYTLDDAVYLYNNASDFTKAGWIQPVFNFSHMVAGNFSDALVDCDTMGNNAANYFIQRWADFSGSFYNLATSFLFNMMGNALKYQSIFTEIKAD
jgi:hypothetical protein